MALVGKIVTHSIGRLIGQLNQQGGGSSLPVLEAFVQTNGPADATVANLTFVAPSGITAGDFLFIISGTDNTGGAPIASCADGSWTKLGEVGSAAPDVQIAVFYKIASGGEGNIQIDYSVSRRAGGWYGRVSGANSTPIDASAFTEEGGSTTAHSIGAITTTVDNCLIIAGMCLDAGGSFTWTTGGWTEQDELDTGTIQMEVGFGTKDQESLGTTGACAITTSSSNGSAKFMMAISPR